MKARSGPSRADAERLIAEAERARLGAYAPYSRFAVGAALMTRDGRVVHGCNVENASFGLSMCAERNAIFRAVGEGERDFIAIAVTAGPEQSAAPCGACRQVMHEFAPHLWVCWRSGPGRLEQYPLDQLLAHGFDLATGRKPKTARARPARRETQKPRRGAKEKS